MGLLRVTLQKWSSSLPRAIRTEHAIIGQTGYSQQAVSCFTTQAQTRLPTMTLFTKDNCPLCDDAVEILRPYMDKFRFEIVNIGHLENRYWFDKYKYDIPVFHLNGQFLMKHRVDTELLQNKLESLDGHKSL